MKVIIRDKNGNEEILYEPEPVKRTKRTIKELLIRTVLVIFFIPIWIIFIPGIVTLPLGVLNEILLKNPAITIFLNGISLTGYIIISIVVTLFLLFLEFLFPDTFGFEILYNDREIIINRSLKSVVFNNTYWIFGKRNQTTIDFSDINGVEIKTYENEMEFVTTHKLVRKRKDWFGFNKTISLKQVPYERVADFARAIDVPLL